MNFYTLFTRTENIHLLKDVGMIPEALASGFSDVKAILVTYQNGEYPFYGTEIKHLQLVFLKKRFGKYIDGIRFLKEHADEIDVLNLYHLNLSSYLYCLAAKKYLKNTAKIYLKLDADEGEVGKLRKHGPVAWVKHRTLRMADYVSAETKYLVDRLQKETDAKIEYIPDGVYGERDHPACGNKWDRILTVGRLGTYQKHTELLIDAFLASMDTHNYQLRLVGIYTAEFAEKIKKLQEKNPEVGKRIELVGEIKDQVLLQEEYEMAKFFAFPSRWESFGLALLEAYQAGCYLLTSSYVPLSYDIIENGKNGEIIAEDTVDAWTEAITRNIKTEPDWNALCKEGFRVTKEQYSWNNIVKRLYRLIIS